MNQNGNERLLENPVWHALQGDLRSFAAPRSSPGFVVLEPDVGIFGAVEEVSPASWGMIARAVGPSGFCGFLRDDVGELPPGWVEHYRSSLLQMIASRTRSSRPLETSELGPNDIDDMLALTALTQPSPFGRRTAELGRYLGVRRHGQLVAMAGERLRVPGFVEISAVCTQPDLRGEGLATGLTLALVESIRAGGDEAFLHVEESNESASRLYRALGFLVRRRVEVVFAQWQGSGD